MDRVDLAAALFASSHLKGTFRLRSGRTASEYFDKYRFESNPTLLAAISSHLLPLVPAGTELLAGLELGGIPIATALGLRSGIPMVFVRKAAKTYGTQQLAEGADITGRQLLIVEDVLTSGGQVAMSGADLRERGAHVTDVLCVVDREEGGRDALAAVGIQVSSLFTAHELKKAHP